MSTFTGGALKLKGGVQPVKHKKKKKSKSKSQDLALVPDADLEKKVEEPETDQPSGSSTKGLPPLPKDRRTEAEKRAEAHMLKYEEARLRKQAAKSHRERVAELNDKLASMTEVRFVISWVGEYNHWGLARIVLITWMFTTCVVDRPFT